MSINDLKFTFNEINQIKSIEIINKYPQGQARSAILPLLDLAQRQNQGWLSVPVIQYIAEVLNLPYIRVYEVASFYSMFNLKPVGKYHLQICGTTPCWLKGANDLIKFCQNKFNIDLGETTLDKMFTINEVECLGACVNAPVVQINDDYHENLEIDSLNQLLDKLAGK